MIETYDEKRMTILRMVEEGTLSASDAATLLSALGREMRSSGVQFNNNEAPQTNVEVEHEHPEPETEPVSATYSTEERGKAKPRYFRVRVTDLNSGRNKVTVNLPIGLVNWGLRMGARFSPEVRDLDFAELKDMLESGAEGRIIDVLDEEDGEHVEIFVD